MFRETLVTQLYDYSHGRQCSVVLWGGEGTRRAIIVHSSHFQEKKKRRGYMKQNYCDKTKIKRIPSSCWRASRWWKIKIIFWSVSHLFRWINYYHCLEIYQETRYKLQTDYGSRLPKCCSTQVWWKLRPEKIQRRRYGKLWNRRHNRC